MGFVSLNQEQGAGGVVVRVFMGSGWDKNSSSPQCLLFTEKDAEQCVQSRASSSPFVENVQLFGVAWDLFRRLLACSCPACAKMEETVGSLKLNGRTKQQLTDQQALEDGQ